MPIVPSRCRCHAEAALSAALNVAERRGLDVYSLEQCRRQLVRDMVKYDEVVARGSPRSLEADGLLGCIGADVDVLAAAFRYVTSVALKGEDALP